MSKSTFHPSGNIKILPKTPSSYLLINNFTLTNTIYRITKEHIIEKFTCSFTYSAKTK